MDNKGYKKLKVWQEAHSLVLLVYKNTKNFPKEEIFGLTSQLKRAVVSVPANIVEGQAKRSKASFLQFLNISNGSLVEVEYYFELARELEFLTDKQYKELEDQCLVVGNLLYGLIKSLKS